MTSPQQLLALPLPENDAQAATVRDYLLTLLEKLWRQGSDFNSKRPFGMSDWQCDLYIPMVKADVVPGGLDEDGYLDWADQERADALIVRAIRALGAPS